MSLHRENLISDTQKEILQQTSQDDKGRTCYSILIQNVTDELILNNVLSDHNILTIEQMITLGKIKLNTLFKAALIDGLTDC